MGASEDMLRFVLHRHDHPAGAHWDLMLEVGDVLATWRLAALPGAQDEAVEAVKIVDHRKSYLTYEGPVSGGRGDVRIVDGGGYELVRREAGRWVVRLEGRRLAGWFVLRREQGEQWTFQRRAGPV